MGKLAPESGAAATGGARFGLLAGASLVVSFMVGVLGVVL